MISSSKATLHECETVYSVEDLYLMLEIVQIDSYNRRIADEWYRKNSAR